MSENFGGGGCGSSEQCIMHQQALPLLHFLSLKMKKKYTVRNTLKMYYVSAGATTTPLSRFEIGKESHRKYISGTGWHKVREPTNGVHR